MCLNRAIFLVKNNGNSNFFNSILFGFGIKSKNLKYFEFSKHIPKILLFQIILQKKSTNMLPFRTKLSTYNKDYIVFIFS